MLGDFNVRTDLALEAKESFEEDDVEIRGVRVEEETDEEREIYTTIVRIETENGARTMGKPVGTYITLEAPNMSSEDEDYHREISRRLPVILASFLGEKEQTVLVVGLGNREVTPDALGPQVVGNLRVTRHIAKGVAGRASLEGNAHLVSAIVPGVMAQTGMETLEDHPRCGAGDGAAGGDRGGCAGGEGTRRLNRTIQITDTGINPGPAPATTATASMRKRLACR